MTLDELKNELLQDPEVKAEYDRLQPIYEQAELIAYKELEGWRLSQIAEKTGIPLLSLMEVMDMDMDYLLSPEQVKALQQL